MTRTWTFLINTFLVATDGSYRLAKKLGDYTKGRLQAEIANPYMLNLLGLISPVVEAYTIQYDLWKTQLTQQKGETSNFNILLKTLASEKIIMWDVLIQVVFPQVTTEYQQILPFKRKPYQRGSQEDRMSAVHQLGINLVGKQQLINVKTEVDAFYAELQAAFFLQKQKMSTTEGGSVALEVARVAVCKELYYCLGMLMAYYKDNPEDAERFFDTESIRNHEQTMFKGTVLAASIKLAMTHTFILGEDLRLVNRGNHDLHFALCTEENDGIGLPYVTVTAHNETIVRAEELGNVATQRYLKVQNLAPAENGKYTIMLL